MLGLVMRSLLSLASLRGGCGPWFDRAGRGAVAVTEGRAYTLEKILTSTPYPMPTKKKRDHLVPAGMPSLLTKEESKEVIPAVYDG